MTRRHVAEFWDRNPHLHEDPTFWMVHPLCRAAINRRVSGREALWPLDFLYEQAGSPRFGRLLSLGCGTGRVERLVRKYGVAGEVEGLDASPVSIEIARRTAAEEGLDGINYSVADLNSVALRARSFDAVIFHESLHHVWSVERLLSEVRLCLLPVGLLFLEEWTGPSRANWTEDRLAPLRALFSEVPAKWRRWPELRPPIEVDDPTEAVRSAAILPAIKRLFRIVVNRRYGGQIVSVLLPQIAREDIPPTELDALVSRWLSLEDAELVSMPDASFYSAMLALPRLGASSVIGRLANALTGWRYTADSMPNE